MFSILIGAVASPSFHVYLMIYRHTEYTYENIASSYLQNDFGTNSVCHLYNCFSAPYQQAFPHPPHSLRVAKGGKCLLSTSEQPGFRPNGVP